ncbi:hypothetical protein ACWDYH_05615 [Nocardia goodfellowii]
MTSFEDFRHIGRAEVYKAGRLAAILLRNPDGSTEFRYLPEYSAADEEPIATNCPSRDRRYIGCNANCVGVGMKSSRVEQRTKPRPGIDVPGRGS